MRTQNTVRSVLLGIFVCFLTVLSFAATAGNKRTGGNKTEKPAAQKITQSRGMPQLLTYRQLVWLKPEQRRKYLSQVRMALIKLESMQEKALGGATTKSHRSEKHAMLIKIRDWLQTIQLFEAANARTPPSEQDRLTPIPRGEVGTGDVEVFERDTRETTPPAAGTNRGGSSAGGAMTRIPGQPVTPPELAQAPRLGGNLRLMQVPEADAWVPACDSPFTYDPTIRRCGMGVPDGGCETGFQLFSYRIVDYNGQISDLRKNCLVPSDLASLRPVQGPQVPVVPSGPTWFISTEEGNRQFLMDLGSLQQLTPAISDPPPSPTPQAGGGAPATDTAPGSVASAHASPTEQVAPDAPPASAPLGGRACKWVERTNCPTDIEATRQQFYDSANANLSEFRESVPYCIYSGNFSKYKQPQPAKNTCSPVTQFQSGGADGKLNCPRGQTVCNPFVFGVNEDGSAICTAVGAHATRNCSSKAFVENMQDDSYKFKTGVRDFKFEDYGVEAEWKQFREQFHQDYQKFCFPNANATIKFADFFCEECNEIGRALNNANSQVAQEISLCVGVAPTAGGDSGNPDAEPTPAGTAAPAIE